jgi:hypothetical protein
MTQSNQKSKVLKRLQTLRNIGPATAKRLYEIGIRTPDQLKRSDPKKLYNQLKQKCGGQLDICVLYQLRGAVSDIPWPDCKDLFSD